MSCDKKPILKLIDYKKIIDKEYINYENTIEELKKNYYDFDKIQHLFKLRPLTYIEYCENFNFEPEKEIIKTIKEEEGVKTDDETLKD